MVNSTKFKVKMNVLNEGFERFVHFWACDVFLTLFQYSQQQVENVKKLAETVQHRQSRFEAGEVIRRQQLVQLRAIKDTLDKNLTEIENRTPYINVKHVVAKIY